SVPDYRSLLHDLENSSDPGRHLDAFVLAPGRDGIDQISTILARYRDLDAVHFVTHGNDRGVQLGATWLDQSTLAGRARRVAGWGAALKPGADLLFYGCDLAAGPEGRVLLDAVH